jgi:hypothetical protein
MPASYYIEKMNYYKRFHSAPGHRPPCEYETLMLNKDPSQTTFTIDFELTRFLVPLRGECDEKDVGSPI